MTTLPQNFTKLCLESPSLDTIDEMEDPFEGCSEFLALKPVQSLYHSIHKDEDKINQTLNEIAQLMPQMHPYRAAAIALMCGSLIESKGNPTLIYPACADLMEKMLTQISPYWASYIEEEELNATDISDEERAYVKEQLTAYNTVEAKIDALPDAQYLELKSYQHAIDILVLPMMAMLMRNAQCRTQFNSNGTLMRFLNNPLVLDNTTLPSEQLYYLVQAAQLYYGELTIILPSSKTGLIVEAHAINNVFHAITLLQDLMAKHAKELDIGNINPDLKHTQKATQTRYNWYNASAYTNGELSNEMAWAWGEAALADLPEKQKHIVLFAEEVAQVAPKRNWDEGFIAPIHSAQEPKMTFVRALTSEEVQAYLQ